LCALWGGFGGVIVRAAAGWCAQAVREVIGGWIIRAIPRVAASNNDAIVAQGLCAADLSKGEAHGR